MIDVVQVPFVLLPDPVSVAPGGVDAVTVTYCDV